MKRYQRLLILLLICIFVSACAPVAAPPAEPNGPSQTPTDPSPAQPDDTEQPTAADNLLLDVNAKENRGVLPRGFADDDERVKVCKGAKLVLYYGNNNPAFSYSDGKSMVNETDWLSALAENYDISVQMVRKNEATALSAQRVALLSGLKLDLLSFTPAQLPFARTMAADLSLLLKEETLQDIDFLNTSLLTYGGNGASYIAPAGVAKALWYTTDGKTSPLALSKKKLWNFTAFCDFVTERTVTDGKQAVVGYEMRDFTDLLSALHSAPITFENSFSAHTEYTELYQTLQNFNTTEGIYYNGVNADKEQKAPTLFAGTLAMRYGTTPFTDTAKTYPAFSWAPLPIADGADNEAGLTACTPILALPKNSRDPEIALNVALLWAARYADANHDKLRFTYGMSFEDWAVFYNTANESLQIVYTANSETTTQIFKMLTIRGDVPATTREIQKELAKQVADANRQLGV